MLASHLLKAVETWTDLGLGDFELHYVRNKQQREVDFLVFRSGEPWFLVEAKHQEQNLSPALGYFQRQLGCPHAFQVVLDTPFLRSDCFRRHEPVVVPARTLLSQLPYQSSQQREAAATRAEVARQPPLAPTPRSTKRRGT